MRDEKLLVLIVEGDSHFGQVLNRYIYLYFLSPYYIKAIALFFAFRPKLKGLLLP